MQLNTDTLLQGGRYKIIDILGQGGFGITYLAIQSGLERKVAIKEFFMNELCNRNESTNHVTVGTESSRESVNRFREKFLKEARNIAKLNHPNIVRVIDVFEENDTAYYVMEYAGGGSLADKVRHEGYLSEPVATRYILQVAEALKYIHQHNMNHLDVKPGNIMLNEKDEAVLIDFGLSKQYDTATDTPTSTNISGLSEGYAPLEQYDGSIKKFAPEIDVYSLGATFFKLLTGSTPPTASVVNNEGLAVDKLKNKGVSAKAISIIVKAMEGRRKDRMKDIQTFIDMMNATEASAIETSEPEDNTIPKVSNMQRAENAHNYKEDTTALPQKQTSSVNNKAVTNNNSTSTTLIAVIAIAVVALIAAFLYMNKPGDTSTPADTIIIDTGAEKEDEDRPAKETIVDEEETNDRDNTEEHQRQAIYKIIKQNVFVRSGPGTTYEPLYSPYNDFDSNNTNGVVVYEGSTVEVISAEQNGFVKVRQSTPNNDRDNWGEGWVSVKFLE